MLAPLVPLSCWPRPLWWSDPQPRKSGRVCAMRRTAYHRRGEDAGGIVAIVADERAAIEIVRGDYGWCWSFEHVNTPW